MAILTKLQLNTITQRDLGYVSLSTVLNEAKSESRTYSETTIFLSHSHTDKEWVEKIVVFFRKLGIRVYVDWMDSAMPPVTSSETAIKIREKIKANKKFILLATDTAIASKWCNWELGFGDAHKYINNIAIFPLSESSGAWTGTEYFRIYPYFSKKNIWEQTKWDFEIIYPDGTKKDIIEWLRTT